VSRNGPKKCLRAAVFRPPSRLEEYALSHEQLDGEIATMTSSTIRFRCPWCSARIKAPVQLVGRSRTCPACRHRFTVPRFAADDADPLFVLVEGIERCSLGVSSRQNA